MEGRPGRGRGGYWKRGGSGGANDAGISGERRGRGRGGHHRGRGKRDHYRGRGRGDSAADFFRRNKDEENDKENEEEEISGIYSRRKLESNWDRYEEPEKEEVNDGVPVKRGTDYHVLLSSAGDSFTQFRFAEEKDWEMDSLAASQVPAIVVDLDALSKCLQELPMHKRLNLETNIVQAATPVEIPSVGLHNKVEPSVSSGFKPPAPLHMGQEPNLGGPRLDKTISGPGMSSQASTAVGAPVDDADKELDLLLGIQKPITELSSAELKTSGTMEEVSVSLEKASVVTEKMKDLLEADQLVSKEEPTKKEEPKPEAVSAKQEITEEDLEDWLDSMIS